MANPAEVHCGVEIYLTSERTLVTSPAGFEYCIDGRETDEGPTLRTFGSIEEAREAVEADADSLARC